MNSSAPKPTSAEIRVPLLDLKLQYNTIRQEIDEAIRRVVESQQFILGPAVKACEEAIKPGLLKLGLITDPKSEQFRTWYTHGVSHWIGMDVHDVGDYHRPLEPGMAFTIEPGVYVRPSALEQLPDTPENRAFKTAVAPAVERFKNLGVRVEDSFLLTASGLEQLSKSVPRTIEEIEKTMAGR